MKQTLWLSILLILLLGLSSCFQKDASNKDASSNTSTPEASEESAAEVEIIPDVDEISGLVVQEAYTLTSSAQNQIKVRNFWEMRSISSPLTLRGMAPRKWFSEGSFTISILTLSEELVAVSPATWDWLSPVEWSEDINPEDMIAFTAEFKFDAPTHTDEWKVRFEASNPSGLSENEDLVDSQIIFAEGGSEMNKKTDVEDEKVDKTENESKDEAKEAEVVETPSIVEEESEEKPATESEDNTEEIPNTNEEK